MAQSETSVPPFSDLSDEARLDSLIEFGNTHIQQDPLLAQATFREALSLSQSLSLPASEALIRKQLGIVAYFLDQYTLALEESRQSLSLYEGQEDLAGQAKVHNNLGIIYKEMGDYRRATDQYFASLTLLERLGRDEEIPRVWLNLGQLYRLMEMYDKAEEFYQKSLKAKRNQSDQSGVANTLYNLSTVYAEQEQFNQAHTCLLEAQKIFVQDSNAFGLARINQALGNLACSRNKPEEARAAFEKALSLNEELGRKSGILAAYIGLGLAADQADSGEEALDYHKKALALAIELDHPEDQRLIHYNLAQSYTRLGMPEQAVEQWEAYQELQDRLYQEEISENLARAEAIYQTEKAQRELLEAQNETLMQKSLADMLRYGLIIAALAIFLAVLLIAIYRQRQQTLKSRLHQQEKVNQQIILDLLHEHQEETLQARLDGEQLARHQIAADLHDRLGGTLAATKVSLASLGNKLGEASESVLKTFEKTENLLTEATRQTRNISHKLAESQTTRKDLVSALNELRDLCAEDSNFRFTVETSGLKQTALDSELEFDLYCIVQELFQNIVKHSEATQVSLQLSRDVDQLNLLIDDNGKGFQLAEVQTKNGLGLSSIANRVKAHQGTLDIATKPGEGTQTSIHIPIRPV